VVSSAPSTRGAHSPTVRRSSAPLKVTWWTVSRWWTRCREPSSSMRSGCRRPSTPARPAQLSPQRSQPLLPLLALPSWRCLPPWLPPLQLQRRFRPRWRSDSTTLTARASSRSSRLPQADSFGTCPLTIES